MTLGMNTATKFVISALIIVVIAFLAVVVVKQLDSSGVGDADTAVITANFTEGVQDLSAQLPTWMIVLAITVLVIIIALAVGVLRSVGGGGGGL